ncbi:hypothetical protein [Nonomuraea dietziae]|uniref:hypothetical protein n=1 Tax=Nonomuraea dietziae TaxID=65515 RepID=UPI0031DC9B79
MRVHVGRPLLRAIRATVFAVACVLVSAALHVLAGGAAVRPSTLAGAVALTWAGAFLLGRRQRGVGVLLAACFAAQYGMHHLFTAGAATPPLAAPVHAHGTSGLGMLLVHVAIAVMSSWWLERGESSLATILHLAVTSLGALWTGLLVLAGALVVPRVPRRPRTDHEADRLRRILLATGVRRRGPPTLLSVL